MPNVLGLDRKAALGLASVVLIAASLAACGGAGGTAEPTTPNEAVKAIWVTFTEDQKSEACQFYIDGRSTYGSSYIADRAEKKYPTFMNGDLYDAAYDEVRANKWCPGVG